MKGPGLFSEIGKKTKDLLNKDYTSDHKFTIYTHSTSGMGLTTAIVKRGELHSFDVGSQYKYKNTFIDVKVDTSSNISTTISVLDILPYAKAIIASVKLPDYSSGKLELQYFHDHTSLASVVTLKQSPIVEVSGTLGTPGVALGAEAGLNTASGGLSKYSIGIGLTKPDYNAAVSLEDKLGTLRASYVYHLDRLQKNSVVAEIVRRFSTNENIVTVGGQQAVDTQTSVRTRLNNSGKLAALLQHVVNPKSVLTISGEFDTTALGNTPKVGLALALKP